LGTPLPPCLHTLLTQPPQSPNHKQGRFQPLREWLQRKVHTQGSLPESLDALLVSATGKPLDPKCFVRYLEEKYAALYDLRGGRPKEEL
jgi:Zn-dependent M32 family carboxypeptidase